MATKLMFIALALCLAFPSVCRADSSLSRADRSLVRLMEKNGFDFRGGVDSLTHNDMEQLRSILKIEFGEDYLDRISNPDPRFSSPESTWELLRSSLLDGDRKTAIQCIAVESQSQYEGIIERLPQEALQKSAEQMHDIHRINGDQRQAEYVAVRNENGRRVGYKVTFVNVFGEWQILSY